MTSIKLSIVIPIYNAEKYIDQCLESILIEVDENVEIILVEDCSTDNSLTICKKWLNKDKRINLFKNDVNSGVSFSRSRGLKYSTGNYIMFVDADDFFSRGWYNKVCTVLELHTGCDYIIFSSSITKTMDRDRLIHVLLGMQQGCNISGVFSKLFRKQFLIDNNLIDMPDVIHGEDMLFNLSVVIRTRNIYIENNDIYIYRLNTNSATHSFNHKIIESDKQFHCYLNELLRISEIPDRENLLQKNIMQAIYVLLIKISYINEFKKKFNYVRFIESAPYSQIGLSEIITESEMSVLRKILLSLAVLRMYGVVVIFLHTRQLMKKIYRNDLFRREYIKY